MRELFTVSFLPKANPKRSDQEATAAAADSGQRTAARSCFGDDGGLVGREVAVQVN